MATFKIGSTKIEIESLINHIEPKHMNPQGYLVKVTKGYLIYKNRVIPVGTIGFTHKRYLKEQGVWVRFGDDVRINLYRSMLEFQV